MNRVELMELIHHEENSRVEFKRDDLRPVDLAMEMAALLNHEGGYIILGVEDDRTVSGLTRDRAVAEEWVMEIARSHLQPATNPTWETIRWDDDTVVGIVSLPADAPDKPYKAKQGSHWITKIRVGSTSRDATREEEQRLYQQSRRLDYGKTPVSGEVLETLDVRRLRDYLDRVLDGSSPGENDSDSWIKLLGNLEFAVTTSRGPMATTAGTLLFGTNPKRSLPQSGVRAICYIGDQPDYAVRADDDLRGPMAPLRARDGTLVEPGLVDQAWDFVRRNTTPTAWLEGPRRIDRWEYPEDVVRESVANALIHRDYSIVGTDVMLAIYSNRLEVVSPGRLPNTVTPEGMKLGARHARNQLLVNVMRDYGYVDARGMGVRNKLIPGMKAHNGTEPDLIEEEYRFTVRLWKEEPARER